MSEKHYPYIGGAFDRIIFDGDGSVWVKERTCHYNFQYTYIDPEDTQDDYPSEAFVCDKCRHYVSKYMWEEYGPFEYCPLCGAKVVEE
jgi:uncharacterized CHY-type Zn-finger protein